MIELNVLEILKKKEKSKYWLFNELNNFSPISYTNFNNIVTNKTKSIKYENIDRLCKILDCDINSLFVEK
ncbi:MAG: helix-turn-helix transcriptional regulator [Clostridia bacterium]|jgi:putative transcriptional regulator|nr:helix-turn-helix transcriptional regulator [Clostridia bacterium]